MTEDEAIMMDAFIELAGLKVSLWQVRCLDSYRSAMGLTEHGQSGGETAYEFTWARERLLHDLNAGPIRIEGEARIDHLRRTHGEDAVQAYRFALRGFKSLGMTVEFARVVGAVARVKAEGLLEPFR